MPPPDPLMLNRPHMGQNDHCKNRAMLHNVGLIYHNPPSCSAYRLYNNLIYFYNLETFRPGQHHIMLCIMGCRVRMITCTVATS
jgi:hypothetical protein